MGEKLGEARDNQKEGGDKMKQLYEEKIKKKTGGDFSFNK